MKTRTFILLIAGLLFASSTYSQEVPQVRVQTRFIEISDKALKDLGLLQAFRKHVLPKGTVKDWYKLEDASDSFRSLETVVQSGQETFGGAVVEAMFPESFNVAEVYWGPHTTIDIPSIPVFGEPRNDMGITMTFTPQVDDAGKGISLDSHPKDMSLVGIFDRRHKSTVGKRTLSAFPIPIFRVEESRNNIVLNNGETSVQTISYRSGKSPAGRYRLLTTYIDVLPQKDARPKAKASANVEGPLRPQDQPIPQIAITLERVLVPSKHAQAIDKALGNTRELQKLYDSGVVEVLSKMSLSTPSGQEAFISDVDEQMIVESFEEMVATGGNGKDKEPAQTTLSLLSPVFGEPRSDLGNTLTVTPQVSADMNSVLLYVHTKRVVPVGTIDYPANSVLSPHKTGNSETVKTNCSTPIFASDEINSIVTVRPGVPLIVSKTGHKNSPRIRDDQKYISIEDKKFEKLEDSKQTHYVYAIIRADIIH